MHHLEVALMGSVQIHELAPVDTTEGHGLAVVMGDIATFPEVQNGPLVRMHSRCLYGEALNSLDCDCGPQLVSAQQLIAEEGRGILFYLDGQEGRGAGMKLKTQGYELRDREDLDTAAAYERLGIAFDSCGYGHCARFLVEHNVCQVRLLTNNPQKAEGLEEAGISVMLVPLVVGVNETNRDYLRVKRDKAGHVLPGDL